MRVEVKRSANRMAMDQERSKGRSPLDDGFGTPPSRRKANNMKAQKCLAILTVIAISASPMLAQSPRTTCGTQKAKGRLSRLVRHLVLPTAGTRAIALTAEARPQEKSKKTAAVSLEGCTIISSKSGKCTAVAECCPQEKSKKTAAVSVSGCRVIPSQSGECIVVTECCPPLKSKTSVKVPQEVCIEIIEAPTLKGLVDLALPVIEAPKKSPTHQIRKGSYSFIDAAGIPSAAAACEDHVELFINGKRVYTNQPSRPSSVRGRRSLSFSPKAPSKAANLKWRLSPNAPVFAVKAPHPKLKSHKRDTVSKRANLAKKRTAKAKAERAAHIARAKARASETRKRRELNHLKRELQRLERQLKKIQKKIGNR